MKLYKKDTDSNAYLHYKSYHPLKLKDNILFGQALYVKKICSENVDVENALAILKSNFIGHRYSNEIIRTELTKVTFINRKELLTEKEKTSPQHWEYTEQKLATVTNQ